ncbi:MAG: DUF559 domain-containing protein [Nocardioides sp.]|nr:DUF559 domain-containing protein [Nocardioides sp.]
MTITETSTTLDPSRPFRRKDALAVGFDPRRRPKDFIRLFHGIYVSSAVELTPLLVAEAVVLSVDPLGSWASHSTAARVWGLPIPPLPGEHVTVLRRSQRRGRPQISCHSAPDGLISKFDHVDVSAPAQVFVDLAALIPLVDLVVVGDHMVRKGLVTAADLQDHSAKTRSPGAALARRAADLVRPGVDSPMETRLRLLIVLAGLPEPAVNVLVGDEIEKRKYDLSYRRSKTILEYDGKHHVEREEQWESDLLRREKIDDDEWRILVFIAKDIYSTPGKTLERIHRVLVQRGEPGVPRGLNDEWRQHFPGHV